MKQAMVIMLCVLAAALAGCNKSAKEPAKTPPPVGQTSVPGGATEPSGHENLMDAVHAKNMDDIRRLLAAGASVNDADAQGYTPLHMAAAGGLTEACALILDKGADVNRVTVDGITPLHNASMSGNAETAELLIKRGAHVMAQDNNGMTPLHTAALMGNTPVAEVLLKNGADINFMNTNLWTPLRVADYGKQAEMRKWLLAHGAKDDPGTPAQP
jgi:uncharacterized protein